MRRDTIFYQLFVQSPALLFDIIPNPPANTAGYTFNSVEVKETSFRIDGVFLQETRVYQDAKAEGKAEGVNEGRQAEGQSLITRQLSRRFGTLSAEVNASIIALSLEQLEDLGEALLDFKEIIDLINWLQINR